MEIIKERVWHNNRIEFRPRLKSDEFMFQHCANGSRSVTTRVFNRDVEPMLRRHGVTEYTIIDRVKSKKDPVIIDCYVANMNNY